MRYNDATSTLQVIGNLYMNPSLLDMKDKYFFNKEDFVEEFHQILFVAINNLHELGAKMLTPAVIEDYLEQRPEKLAVYKVNKGTDYLQTLQKSIQIATFDYYYQRMKKMTLLRMYNEVCGMDLSWLYDKDNILDIKKKQKQEEWLDNTSLATIADIIDKKISDIRLTYVEDCNNMAVSAGDGAHDLLNRLRETPEIGYPLYDGMINTVTRGARRKKLYLRSAATGVGKTRSMIADACSIACDELYNIDRGEWVNNGTQESVIFISTEQELEEIQTMVLAFIANVNEEHIITGEYLEGEWSRVQKAADILEETPLYIQQLPDFSLQDIENTIKSGIRDYQVNYVFFDYIHTSMKILTEITSKTGIKGLREDNILFMISIRLKDLCNQYDVFIMTATQLNADYKTSDTPDQNLLRGAKSIADKIDFGAIMMEVTKDDLTNLEPVINQGAPIPDVKISIYKNRRGQYKGIYLWAVSDRGTCRINSVFATKWNYELVQINKLNVKVKPKKEEF